MNAMKSALFSLLYTGVSVPTMLGQAFNSGSDGSYGSLNVTATTNIPVPANGIFNCTTISVSSGQTLRFTKNANNTPVYLLATGNVMIAGLIDIEGGPGNNVVGGPGGPGGFDGGSPGSISLPPGAGHGPGGGSGGLNENSTAGGAGGGSYATISPNTVSTNRGATYGSGLLVPLVGGSGGGGTIGTPGGGGGGGGGALLIASNTRIDVTGTISADGARRAGFAYNSGSGGAIRLVAPVVAGTGALRARGSSGFFGEGGGDGRIRIDALNRTGISFSFNPAASTSIGSMMMVFPAPLPRLDITEAAGTAITVGSVPVVVILPFGSSTNRTVRVQASNFSDLVPINVVLTPDNGTPVTYQAQIDNRAVNPAETTVNVVIPVNVQTAIYAWTR